MQMEGFVFVFAVHTECNLKGIIFLSLCYIPSSEARCGVNLMIENQIVRTMATAFSSQIICQMIKMHCLYDQFYTGGYSFKKQFLETFLVLQKKLLNRIGRLNRNFPP